MRPVDPADNPAVAALIRDVMKEFGADGEGFSSQDPEVDAISEAYAGDRAAFLVVERDGRIVGGGGFAPLAGGDDSVCELQKMYFYPQARGHGMGKALLTALVDGAREAGFKTCYLETLASMDAAARLYEAFGFERIDGPMGATGHFSCNRFMAKAL